jgi:DivIVA domain-containing protein
MALTPEDIVNKRFQSTKFREGYDQDEVDDFLDEVVVEMRRVVSEKDELAQRLAGMEGRISELQRSGASGSAVGVSGFAANGETADTANANNLLQLARRLHEDHVREGIEKRDQLIAEGHGQAARIIAEVETEHRAHLMQLEGERGSITQEVEQLRTFEREYRASLQSFINGQLGALGSSNLPQGASDTRPA